MYNKKARFDNLPCFPQMNFRKRGWILILEATIAILIVTGALLAVYSQQTDRGVDLVDYYNDLQGQILADISARSDLRLNVLNVEEEDFGDGNFTRLNDFIGGKIPEGFGYSIRVCELGSETDFCKMRAPIFIATMDKDIYVEEIIVSSEIGKGTNAVYNPKKLRLFVWEGEEVAVDCENECSTEGVIFGCLDDGSKITKRVCGNFDMDFCLEWEPDNDWEDFENCEDGKECVDGLGVCVEPSNNFNLTCEKKTVNETGCVYNFNDECDEWNGGGIRTGGCGIKDKEDAYECYNIEILTTDCSESPVCPSGYTEVARENCVLLSCVDTSWTPSLASVCIGETFTQISNCGETRSAVGTKNCVAELSASYVIDSIGESGSKTYYYYTDTISETNGVGVTINSMQVCYDVAGCNPIRYDITNLLGSNYIISSGQISSSANWYTSYSSEKITQTFWGTDDNGNAVLVSYSMNHPL